MEGKKFTANVHVMDDDVVRDTKMYRCLYSLIIIGFAVKFAVSGVTSPCQDDATNRTLQTRFMP